MKILVTGGAGLIGSHLIDLLLEHCHEVHSIDNLSFGRLSNLSEASKNKNFKFFQKDVKDLENLHDEYDAIFHMASLKKVWDGSIDSSDVMEENYEMTKCVVKKCLKQNSTLIFASTSDIYGNSKTFSEDSEIVMGPPTHLRYSYALSKWHSEQFILNNVKEKKLKANISRIFGCASSRSSSGWSGGHVPLFVNLAKNDKDIVIHGNGRQTRSICHAKDIACGLRSMLKLLPKDNGEIINLGTDQQTTVEYVAKYIVDKISSKSRIVYKQDFHESYNEILVRYANVKKAKKMLDFSVRYTTEDVIDEIIQMSQQV